MEKQRLVKYLKGTSKALETLSKEVEKLGIDKESLELMEKIGSDLLFKGASIDITELNLKSISPPKPEGMGIRNRRTI